MTVVVKSGVAVEESSFRQPSDNLLHNGSFENLTTVYAVDHWAGYPFSGTDGGNGALSQSSDYADDGVSSGMVTVDPLKSYAIMQQANSYNNVNGDILSVVGKAKAKDADTALQVTIVALDKPLNSDGTLQADTRVYNFVTQSWTLASWMSMIADNFSIFAFTGADPIDLSCSVAVPAGFGSGVYIHTSVNSNSGIRNSVYFDSFHFYWASDPTTDVCQNGSFEDASPLSATLTDIVLTRVNPQMEADSQLLRNESEYGVTDGVRSIVLQNGMTGERASIIDTNVVQLAPGTLVDFSVDIVRYSDGGNADFAIINGTYDSFTHYLDKNTRTWVAIFDKDYHNWSTDYKTDVTLQKDVVVSASFPSIPVPESGYVGYWLAGKDDTYQNVMYVDNAKLISYNQVYKNTNLVKMTGNYELNTALTTIPLFTNDSGAEFIPLYFVIRPSEIVGGGSGDFILNFGSWGFGDYADILSGVAVVTPFTGQGVKVSALSSAGLVYPSQTLYCYLAAVPSGYTSYKANIDVIGYFA